MWIRNISMFPVSFDVTLQVLDLFKDSGSQLIFQFYTVPSVRGGLFKCINLWHTLLASCSFWMLLARATKFPSSSFRNLFTKPFVPPTVNNSFISEAVNRLLSFNLIPERFHIPDIVYPLFFIHSGEHRFISDSRHIYAFICWQKNLSVIFHMGFYLF